VTPAASQEAAQAYLLELRSPAEMTQEDRALEAGAESAIRESAELKALEFRPEQWASQQLVCPALPQHLLLEFKRNNGAGDVSAFTASIPRNGNGRVRVVPVQLRGYSLFSPAPANAMTIAVFNRIVAEEHGGLAANRIGIGLCYAALAGVHARATAPQTGSESKRFLAGKEPVMEIPGQSGAVVRFTDIGDSTKPMDWAMTFDGAGKLIKAEYRRAQPSSAKSVVDSSIEAQASSVLSKGADRMAKPVPEAVSALRVRPVPQGDVNLKSKPIPATVLDARSVPQGDVNLKSKPIPETVLVSRPVPQ
jgi:hypothetical protein